MNIIPVRGGQDSRKFLKVAKVLYRDDPVWVCPLDREIEAIFDPAINVFFKHGVAKRWILVDAGGNLAGRIAAFIDNNSAKLHDQPTGGTGFFECINDPEAAA